jgi:hypothetical protein
MALGMATRPQVAWAADDAWKNSTGDAWTGTNTADWYDITSGTAFVPQNATGFYRRAVIGTDNPNGALAGSATISATFSPASKNQIAGLAFGVRQLDYTVAPPATVNPTPAAGALTGALTISAGTLNCTVAANSDQVAQGADGTIQVGVDGRGYLTMTGGTLTGQGLTVAGENNTTGNGTSFVSLSGSGTQASPGTHLNITGTSTFNRRLMVTGPGVDFSTTGNLKLTATNAYTANITDAASQSPLKTGGNAIVSGALNVNFSGAAATRDPVASLGTTWDLVDSSFSGNAIAGNFSNLSAGGDVSVSGLDAAHSAPLGGAYRLQKISRVVSSVTHSVLQLAYEKILILTVNRDTGQMSVRNPYAGNIGIDGYSISSPLGSLVTSYAGLGAATPGAGTWSKPVDGSSAPLNTVNVLTEYKDPDFSPPNVNNDVYNLTAVPTVSLGNGFNRTAVAGAIANFGTSGEDLTFDYTNPNGGTTRGVVEYVGNKFFNNLVLRVNPNTGQAFIKNDSQVTLKFDGYSIVSSTTSLNAAGFTGLGGSWANDNVASGAITQTNLTASTTLAPGASLPVGTIGTFTTAAAQAGLSLQFILSQSLVPGAVAGDYNNDGVVDAGDYAIWRSHPLGSTFTLPNEDPSTTPGTVTIEDYNYWKAHFGAVGTGPETTFRNGSIFFDTSAGSGSFSGASVPEPSAALLMVTGLGLVSVMRRRMRSASSQLPHSVSEIHKDKDSDKGGVRSMSWPYAFCAAGFCLIGSLLTALTASAATGGIPLTNGDFELPGPVGTKVVAFDSTGTTGALIPGIIPGWTFTGGSGIASTGETHVGVGNALFPAASDTMPGDSGTEGGGHPGNELLLSTFDGKVYQTSGTNIAGLPVSGAQDYRLSFDAHDVFTIYGEPATQSQYTSPLTNPIQITARLYYGAARTTLLSTAFNLTGTSTNYVMKIGGTGDTSLPAAAIGQPIGVEFDTTTYENSVALNASTSGTNPVTTNSWAGVDNVLLQIAPTTAGDLNGDGSLTTADYDILRAHQQTTSPYIADGELTGDGIINLNDFRAFRSLFGTGSGSGSGTVGSGAVPEPSTLLLSLLGLAVISGVRFVRNLVFARRFRYLAPAAVAIGAILLSSSRSQAVQLAYDPIDDTNGNYTDGPIAGQNPTIGPASPSFFSGGWNLQGNAAGDPGPTVQPTSLSYIGSPSIGGSIAAFNSTTGLGYGRVQRFLNASGNPTQANWDGTMNGTFYIGFEVNFGTVGADGSMGYHAVEFFPTGVSPGENRNGDIGYNQFFSSFGASQTSAATAKMQFNIGGQQIIDSAPDNYNADGATHLMVLKFVLSSTAPDVISLFLDPTSAVEPVIPTNTVTIGTAGTGNNGFTLGAFGPAQFAGAGNGTQMDEIRVGTTYADSLPELPIPGDTNGDKKVDMADYLNIFHATNLFGANVPNTALDHPDVNGDGKVTIADFRIWKDNRTDIPSGSGAFGQGGVPEPASWVLLAIGSLMATTRVWRRKQRAS